MVQLPTVLPVSQWPERILGYFLVMIRLECFYATHYLLFQSSATHWTKSEGFHVRNAYLHVSTPLET